MESAEFVELICYLNPTKKADCRRVLGRLMVARQGKLMEYIIRLVNFSTVFWR